MIKKAISAVLTAVMLCSMFAGCGDSHQQGYPQEENRTVPEATPVPVQPIEWQNETFRRMICDSLLKDYSEDIYPGELEDVTVMYILADKRISLNGRPYENIEPEKPYEIRYSGVMKTDNGYRQVDTVFTDVVPLSLNDLKYFPNLTELYIHLVYTEDLSFAADIPQLNALGMGCCDIDNISGVKRCKNLKTLYMPYNNISDLSPLAQTELWDLFLPHNKISDISPLAEMKAIPDELVLSYNNISDISALKGGAFNYLNLRNNSISDISVLADCSGMPILSLTYNNISDVSPLKNLPKDCTIYLRGNPVKNRELLKDFDKVYTD